MAGRILMGNEFIFIFAVGLSNILSNILWNCIYQILQNTVRMW